MLSPELLTLYRSHADEDDSGFYSIHAVRDLFDHIDAQAERIAAMIAAGDRLLEYDAHLVECRLHRIGGQPASECDCGWYVDAANWQRATER